jgi:hypothetical protein
MAKKRPWWEQGEEDIPQARAREPIDVEPEPIKPIETEQRPSNPTKFPSNCAIWDAPTIELVLMSGASAKSADNIAIMALPTKGVGTLVSRANIALRLKGKILVNKNISGLVPILSQYGFVPSTEIIQGYTIYVRR